MFHAWWNLIQLQSNVVSQHNRACACKTCPIPEHQRHGPDRNTTDPHHTLSPILFIIVIYMLNLIVAKAAEIGLLQPLSLYVDDVVLFPTPTASNIDLTLNILQLFCGALGLKTTVQKSRVVPIQ
jgi:hypothetical protein